MICNHERDLLRLLLLLLCIIIIIIIIIIIQNINILAAWKSLLINLLRTVSGLVHTNYFHKNKKARIFLPSAVVLHNGVNR